MQVATVIGTPADPAKDAKFAADFGRQGGVGKPGSLYGFYIAAPQWPTSNLYGLSTIFRTGSIPAAIADRANFPPTGTFGQSWRGAETGVPVSTRGEAVMLDAMMLVAGVGMFACFLAYIAVCDRI